MKLYFHPGSGNARKARLAAALAGVDLDLALVDVFAGEHKKPVYLAINPNGMVPTLDDDGFVLWEANAIAQYIASSKASPILPSEARARADVTRWLCWDLAHWTPAAQTLAFERLFKKLMKIGGPDPAAVERGLAAFHRFAKVLDAHLTGRDHVVGSAITLADTSLASSLTYAAPAEMPVGDYPNVTRWLGRVQALDAWKQTAPPSFD